MLAGVSGSLISHHFAEHILQDQFAGHLGESSAAEAHSRFRRWWCGQLSQLGPASSTRTIWNIAVIPLAELLGFQVSGVADHRDCRVALLTSGDTRVGIVAGHWDLSLDVVWRETVRHAIELQVAWSLCTNGHQLRLVDTHRTYSRAHVEFDLEDAAMERTTFQLLWALLRADAFRQHGAASLVSDVVAAASRHGQAVSKSLRFGVIDAVGHLLTGLSGRERSDLASLFDQSLTVIYRALFLMFAEARRLVPTWHPLYRASYTIESLRDRIEMPGNPIGIWESLQAISRLAHRGCHAGTLVVPPFNGGLFSPARAPLLDSCKLDDESARRALLGLSTTVAGSKRQRIDYRDLGVEQLGAVYESVLDYEPARTGSRTREIRLRPGGRTRKATGSFYTPQSITDYVVRRTLHPLVTDAPPEAILRLRIIDPAMGSGAFLVSACRYLAGAYERALVRDGVRRQSDIDETDRAIFRRRIAQRCLFGVDLNPTAVQLARLSMWLATLSAGKPLTFLDHRLVCGDSLLGASPVDVTRQPPVPGRSTPRGVTPSLFSETDLEATLARAVGQRQWMAETSDDTVDVVREKERRLLTLRQTIRWRAIADLWCACWLWPTPAPTAATFAALSDEMTRGGSPLPAELCTRLLKQSQEIAQTRRFFHWVLEFPETYFDDHGRPLDNPGFDAVVGNPPWDMLRANGAEKLFFRHAGIYRHQGSGHINRYQLFLERALMLTRRGGRIGMVLPAGFATDHTAAPLRRHLLAHSSVDTITGFENRKAIFPIHRSVRFLICTSTVGRVTARIDCRFGLDEPAFLERISDDGDGLQAGGRAVTLTPDLISAIGGERFAIPELHSEIDVRILEGIVHRVPRLSDDGGWNIHFGRELNATDDRHHFTRLPAGLPVLEGKHIAPFRVHVDRASNRILKRDAEELLGTATFMRERLAYRDVASSTNRLSLIAAIVPAKAVTTHSLVCLKTPLPSDEQLFLCGMLNSFVANYLVRLFMTTHLGSSSVESLRVPKPASDSTLFRDVVELSRVLVKDASAHAYACLQALAARCYELTAADFEHVIATFPLIEAAARDEAMSEFLRMTP